MAREYNLDGLVGPTHHYGGLSFGNVASQAHEGQTSNPRKAARQGLAKMRRLVELGLPQAIMPPQLRPELSFARRLGFTGTDEQVIARASAEAPLLLAACYSSSAMWTANAATVSPSADSEDGRVHFTPANLFAMAHRSIEAPMTSRALRTIFADDEHFVHHEPLPATAPLGDEGAANHNRFATAHGEPGVQLFVYGASAMDPAAPKPKIFPARQTLEASQSIARLHRVPANRVYFVQQNPEAIDLGVFHNDVVAVSNLSVFLEHEDAFADSAAVAAIAETHGIHRIVVPRDRVPIDAAVSTYLFNSQLVTLPSGHTALIAPGECEENETVRLYIEELIAGDAPVDEAHFFDVRQSMHGGGGPACLRLRIVLTDAEAAAMNRSVCLDDQLFERVGAWIDTHYRDRLTAEDLADPGLIDENKTALAELTTILDLGSFYDFQR